MSTPLRIVFMGTPAFAVPSLRALLEADPEKIGRVVGVVTQPDRPKGRGQQLTPSPVKVLAQRAGLPILQMETAGELAARLAPIGGRLLVKTIGGLKDGTLTSNPQDHSRATLAPLLKKEDGMLRWDEEATALANRIRGLTPWPGAYTFYGDERWQLWRAEPANPGCAMAEPGVILEVTRETIRVAAGKGALLIRELQPASGKRLSVKQYLAGHPVSVGSRLGPGPCDPSPDAL